MTARLIEKIESGEEKISFEDFEIFCLALDVGLEKVLSCAIHLKDTDAKDEQGALRELYKETQYQIWA